MKKLHLRLITECGTLMAASLALSTFKILKLANGGSISLGCMPLIILSARHGALIGCLCGMLQGILMTTISPTIVHPLEFILDYPLAYCCMGISGICVWISEKEKEFKLAAKAITAITAAYTLRMLMHVIAGTVFFSGEKALKEALMYSFFYNLWHILPECLICSIFAWLLIAKRNGLCARQ